MGNQGYVCLGSCKASISKEEHRNGLIICGTDGCNNEGKPFVKGNKCPNCGVTYTEYQTHHC